MGWRIKHVPQLGGLTSWPASFWRNSTHTKTLIQEGQNQDREESRNHYCGYHCCGNRHYGNHQRREVAVGSLDDNDKGANPSGGGINSRGGTRELWRQRIPRTTRRQLCPVTVGTTELRQRTFQRRKRRLR